MPTASPSADTSVVTDTFHRDDHYEQQLDMGRGYFRILRQKRAGPAWIRVGRSVRYGERAVASWLAAQQVVAHG